jgi:hypothetical protein
MKTKIKLFSALFGIIALSAVMVFLPVSCSNDPEDSPPAKEIPAELRNTTWSHTDGTTLELSKDKVTITKANGSSATYSFKKTSEASGNTVLEFNTDSDVAGIITIKNGAIIGIVFPFTSAMSGDWSEDSGSNNNNNNNNVYENVVIDGNLYKYSKDYSGYYLSEIQIPKTSLIITDKINNIPVTAVNTSNIPENITNNITTIIIPDSVKYFYYITNNYSSNSDMKWYFKNITHITIGNGITSIGDYAFHGCTSLTSITIGSGVTSIGYSAFSGCTSLTSITIGSGVTSIGYNAFAGCTSLTGITIPDSVTSIEDRAFAWCESLTSITIGSGVTSIGYSAFSDCTSLTSVTIRSGVTSIGYNAFAGCTSLTGITIPNSVTSIEQCAFSGCTSLTNIVLSDNITIIDANTFYGCKNLNSIIIPNSVKNIKYHAFPDSLNRITIGSNVNIDDNAFDYHNNFSGYYDLYKKTAGTYIYTYPISHQVWIDGKLWTSMYWVKQ